MTPPENLDACRRVGEDLTEFALGSVTGRRRSEILAHVSHCARCSIELEQLALASDALLQLAPESEPPIGFETRVVERMRDSVEPRPRRMRRMVMATAAAVAVLLLGIGLGVLVTSDLGSEHDPHQTANLASASLVANGTVLGKLYVSPGSPPWMFMTVDGGVWAGNVTCQITTTNGKIETVGRFRLSRGYGAWAVPLHLSVGKISAARLVDASGNVLAVANLQT